MNKLLVCLALLLNASMLFSCQGKSGTAAEGPGNSLTESKVAKPGAQISLLSDTTLQLVADKVTRVDIVLQAQLGDGTMHVELNPGDGLQLRGTERSYDFVLNSDGQYLIRADLYAAVDGRYYLNLNATLKSSAGSSFRSLAVIVQVGAPALLETSSPAPLKKVLQEDVISLPAEEQIINQ